MLYHQATRDYYQEVYITVRRGVICDLDCSLYPCTTHRQCFYTVESSKPSFDRLINLVIYYAMLRKTAEGNNYGRITTTNI